MRRSRWSVALALLLAGLALAGGNYDQFLAALAHRESGGKASIVNYAGYAGLYQMGEGALIDAGYYQRDGTSKNDWRGSWTGKNGITSLSAFLHNPAAQTQAITDYQAVLWRQIQARGLDRYVGQTVGGATVTESALIGGAHLIGAGGLKRCLGSGRGCTDGLGTTAASYMNRFGGYDVSGVIGRASLVTPSTGGSGATGSGAGAGSGGSGASGGGTPASYAELVPDETPAQAFESTSGYAPSEVRQTALEALTLAMLSWLAWTVWQQYHGWRKGRHDLMDLNVQMVRATAIVLVLLGIVLT